MIRLFKSIIIILLLASFLLLTACTTPGIGNNPPYITSLTANPTTIEINQTTILTCTAYDSDGDTLTYIWNKDTTDDEEGEEEEDDDEPPEDERILPSASKAPGTISGTGKTVTWKAPSSAGTYTVTCTVSDGRGGEDSDSIDIVVTDVSINNYVKILSVTPDSGLIDGVETDFVIEVEYKLDSSEKGWLDVHFNSEEPNAYTCPINIEDSIVDVDKGMGFHVFNVYTKPKNWGDLADFRVCVGLFQWKVKAISIANDCKILYFK